MAEVTKIQWTTHTFNPWIGCTKVAPGCANCYAEADMDKRRGRVQWGPKGTRSRTTDAYWREPLKWDKEAAAAGERHRVFCASLADVFEDWTGRIVDAKGLTLHHGKAWYEKAKYVSRDIMIGKSVIGMNDLRKDLFELIHATPNLDWLLLTKRPENIRRMLPIVEHEVTRDGVIEGVLNSTFWPNVWLGTSISDQATADKAVPELLKCRDLVPVLFLSAEPLLGPVDLTRVGNHDGTCANRFDGNCLYVGDIGGAEYAWSRRNFLSWVIVGGESGPNARPCCQTWIRELVRQCSDAGVSCFVKQFGSNAEEGYGVNRKLRLKDSKGGDPDEWPEDLRVREFPGVVVSR